ncbi:MAG: peroxiredoxin [Verrucomicrobia bacterium]|nr:peroxiredoxin [Verrucomicrobiota bacterium]
MELKVGDRAPDFKAQAVGGIYGEGQAVRLTDLAGSPVVLYFYPKDDTPGCTRQACGLRDAWNEIQSKARLFGVSVDSTDSHRAFAEKYGLPFPLLSDADHQLVEAYGVWVEKDRDGKKYMGTERTTFVIDPDQKIAAVLRNVDPQQHVNLLLPHLS